MPATSYLDTSFLVKSYVIEVHSIDVTRILESLPAKPIISALTDVEVASAVRRKLSLIEAREIFEVYTRDRQAGLYREVAIPVEAYKLAGRLVLQHGHSVRLRSLDAIHLATALYHGADTFATYDDRLATAAAALGLSTIGARP